MLRSTEDGSLVLNALHLLWFNVGKQVCDKAGFIQYSALPIQK